jgi:hypothetical protein
MNSPSGVQAVVYSIRSQTIRLPLDRSQQMTRLPKLRVAGRSFRGVLAHDLHDTVPDRRHDARAGGLSRRPGMGMGIGMGARAAREEDVDPAIGGFMDGTRSKSLPESERVFGDLGCREHYPRPVPNRSITTLQGSVRQGRVQRLLEIKAHPALVHLVVGMVPGVVVAEIDVEVVVEEGVASAGAGAVESKLLGIHAAIAVGVGPGKRVGLVRLRIDPVVGRRPGDRLGDRVVLPAAPGPVVGQRHRDQLAAFQIGPHDEPAVGDQIHLALAHDRPVVREGGERWKAPGRDSKQMGESARTRLRFEFVAADQVGAGTVVDLAGIARHRRGTREELRAAEAFVENRTIVADQRDPPQPAPRIAAFDDVKPTFVCRDVGDFGEAIRRIRSRLASALDAVAIEQPAVVRETEYPVVGRAVGDQHRPVRRIPGQDGGIDQLFGGDHDGLAVVGIHPHDTQIAQHERRAVGPQHDAARPCDLHLADDIARLEVEPTHRVVV